MKRMQWVATTAALALVLGSGCKKEEPAKGGDKTEKPAAKPEGAAKAGDKKAGAEAKAPEAAAKAAEAAKAGAEAATKKVDEVKKAADGAVKKAEDAVKKTAEAPKPAAAAVAMPTDVLGYIALPSFDSIFKLVDTKAKKFGVPVPAEANPDAVLGQVKAALKLKNMDWFKRDASLVVVGWNPKKSEQGLIVVPVTGKDALMGALPDDKKENDEGNAVSIKPMNNTAYINFIDGHAVVSFKPKAFGEAKGYLTSLTKDMKMDGLAMGSLSMANLRTIFAEELKKGLADMKAAKPELEKQLQADMPPIPGLTGLDKMADFMFDAVEIVANEAEMTGFQVKYADDGSFSLPLTMTVKSGGKIAEFAKAAMDNTDLSFVSAAPKTSWMLIGGRMDPKAFGGLTGWAVELVSGFLKLDDAEKKALTGHMNTMMELQDGSSWSAYYADGTFPMAFATAAGVSDGKKYKAAMDAYMGLMFKKVMGLAKETLPPNLQALEGQGFTKIVETLNGITKNMGVTLVASDAMNGQAAVQSLSLTVDVATLEKMAGPDNAAKLKEFTGLLGNKLEFAMASGPKQIGMAFGPNAIKTATDIANGTFKGGSTVATKMEKGIGMFFHIDASAALAAFKPLVTKIEPGAPIPNLPAGLEFGVAAGAKGNDLTMQLYGNLDKIVEVAKMAMTMAPSKAPVAAPAAKEAAPAPAPAPAADKKAAPAPQ